MKCQSKYLTWGGVDAQMRSASERGPPLRRHDVAGASRRIRLKEERVTMILTIESICSGHGALCEHDG